MQIPLKNLNSINYIKFISTIYLKMRQTKNTIHAGRNKSNAQVKKLTQLNIILHQLII